MAINIPSNLPLPPLQDFRQQELIRPTEAPSIIEGVNAVDPRVALNLAMPVAPSGNGSNLSDSVSSGLNNSAVILEITNAETANLKGESQNLAQSIAKLDSLGSIALGELLSELFASDQSNPANLKTTVAWPRTQNNQSELVVANNLKLAMSTLYKNLEDSGIFAANQLKSLMMPASKSDEDQHAFHQTLVNDASLLLSKLNTDNPLIKDSVKLLLKGDLVWQGQLLPGVKANIYRQDAWEGDPHNPSEVIKGTRFTLSVSLPNLGSLNVIGTQFGEQVTIGVQTSNQSKEILLGRFDELIHQISQKDSSSININFVQNGDA